eukprot:CAMPEP_0172699716 /NCGR_PEP_ID=MMETSP1074-20121228/30387_1 /TAXON_ID=2916 /ORGANISM="Ceratium fusus, Strain PA161109" /LENGTH=358 /DNA_ID=CAMNT_0013520973 /DNA_START=106 /DNA_END=1182 /DNA_ORIENTATION=-
MASLLHLEEDEVRKNLAQLCHRGDTETILAVFAEAPEKVRTIVSGHMDAHGNSGLHLAVLMGNLRLLQELVAQGCFVNARDTAMQTALHVASSEDHPELVLELLLANADVNARDKMRQTPLHKAALRSGVEVSTVLLEQGCADLGALDITQSTPLHLAASLGRIEQMAVFLARDAGLVHAHNDCGWTALHLAAHGLERKKTSIANVKFLPAVKLLLDAKAPVDACDEDKRTPLHRAIDTGNCETAATLITAGADVSAADITRWTPLHHACKAGHLEAARLLLKARAAVQREEPVCLTPLALATMENQVKITELLVQHHADPNLRAKGLASAAMIARKEPEKYDDILSLFELGFVNHID